MEQARLAPAGPAPFIMDDGDKVDVACLDHRVGDEMRSGSTPELHAAMIECVWHVGGVAHAAPCYAVAEPCPALGKHLSAYGGPYAIGTDQSIYMVLPAREAAARLDGLAVRVGRDVLELPAEPQFDVRRGVHLREHGGLQIGAVHEPVGCAIAAGHFVAGRNADDCPTAPCIDDVDSLRRHRGRGQ